MCPQVSLNNVSLACGSACYVMPLFFQMLTKFVAEKLVADAHLYELKRHDWIYMDLYTDFVWVYGVRHRALELLGSMAKEAKQDLK
jgi:hypothetical protein